MPLLLRLLLLASSREEQLRPLHRRPLPLVGQGRTALRLDKVREQAAALVARRQPALHPRGLAFRRTALAMEAVTQFRQVCTALLRGLALVGLWRLLLGRALERRMVKDWTRG